ncbi:MAG: c-type cytochrome biogenesis protein CcmI [Burkholderiaceae bacterium]
MIAFAIASIVLFALTLVLLAQPWSRRARAAVPVDAAAGQARLQLQQLDALRASGALDAAAHAQARERIERQLGAAITAPPVVAAPTARPSKALVAGMTLFAGIVVVAGYAGIGAPAALDPAALTAAAPQEGGGHAITMEQIQGMAEKLAERLKDKPDDVDGWAMLGRSYAVLGQHDKAAPAFKQAMTLRPDDAALIADYADALGVANGRNLEGEPSRMIERALKIDPNNLKALSLAGTVAFYRRDYAGALKHWEKMATIDASSPFVQQIQGGIEEAKKLMAEGGAQAPSAAPAPIPSGAPFKAPAAPAATAAAAEKPAAAGKSVSGVVSLAPALAAKAGPEDTVFIFARAAEGPRMPLAILRKQVKDLPLTFTLDDSMAMTPATKLSSVQRVIIGARISKRGDATAQPGDLQGLSMPVAPGASGLKIEISQVVQP